MTVESSFRQRMTDTYLASARDFANVGISWEDHALALIEAQQKAREAGRQLEERAAVLRLSPEVEGKNTEERQAKLTLLMTNDGDYRKLQQMVDSAQRQVEELKVKMQAHRDTMAANRYAMNLSLALIAVDDEETAAGAASDSGLVEFYKEE